MNTSLPVKLQAIPTPIAGLALGVASLGWIWEAFLPLHGWAQTISALIAGGLLLLLTAKFLLNRSLVWNELAHPVVGSVLPTFAMTLMVVSKAVSLHWAGLAVALWLAAIALHLLFLGVFVTHRARDFRLHHMVPAWFVPPVGLIVADVTFPGNPALLFLAQVLLYFGLGMYAIMLPMMLYRLIFVEHVPEAAKPTIAIMAAPASLGLAGYLTLVAQPQPMLVALLASIAVLMTLLIYTAFFDLLQLPFSPGYAAFTFPMVIGVKALVMLEGWLVAEGADLRDVQLIHLLADVELAVATVVVGYVAVRYVRYFLPSWQVTTRPAGIDHGVIDR